MVGNHQRRRLEGAHYVESRKHPVFRVARWVRWKCFVSVEAGFQAMKNFSFVGRVRNNQAAMISPRSIQLHTVKLDDLGYLCARFKQLGISHLPVDLTVKWSTVIRRDHPGQPETPRHRRIHRSGVDGISRDNWCRRVLRRIPADAEAAVNVMVPSQPTRSGCRATCQDNKSACTNR